MFEEHYETNDLYYAAFLKSAGCNLVDFRNQSGKITFVFENTPRIKDLMLDYSNRKAQISALDYADNIRNLKSICWSKRKSD